MSVRLVSTSSASCSSIRRLTSLVPQSSKFSLALFYPELGENLWKLEIFSTPLTRARFFQCLVLLVGGLLLTRAEFEFMILTSLFVTPKVLFMKFAYASGWLATLSSLWTGYGLKLSLGPFRGSSRIKLPDPWFLLSFYLRKPLTLGVEKVTFPFPCKLPLSPTAVSKFSSCIPSLIGLVAAIYLGYCVWVFYCGSQALAPTTGPKLIGRLYIGCWSKLKFLELLCSSALIQGP